MPIGFMGFLEFVLYYLILKAIVHVIHVETRRSGSNTASGVTGLLA